MCDGLPIFLVLEGDPNLNNLLSLWIVVASESVGGYIIFGYFLYSERAGFLSLNRIPFGRLSLRLSPPSRTLLF